MVLANRYHHLARLSDRLNDDLPGGLLQEVEVAELQRILYSLSAIVRLHFA